MINYQQPIKLLVRALQTEINTVTYGAHTGRVKYGYIENCRSISKWFCRKVKPCRHDKRHECHHTCSCLLSTTNVIICINDKIQITTNVTGFFYSRTTNVTMSQFLELRCCIFVLYMYYI